MTEIAVEWESTVEAGARYPALRPVSASSPSAADFLARVRAVGEKWAGDHRGDLVDALLLAAGDNSELAGLVRDSGSILQEFLEGVRRRGTGVSAPRDLAADLIIGHEVPQDVLDGLAAEYLVVLVRTSSARSSQAVPREVAGPGTLSTRHEGDLVLLIPDDLDADRTARITERLTQWLDGDGWIALARRSRARLADGFQEAADVLRLIAAGRRPSGAFTIADVLVEYAVVRHAGVSENLAAVIKPLRTHRVLWETLSTLIDADHNRNKAAKNLFIHRSTLDYRLQRIASLTGYDPTNGRDLQLLTAAMIADSVR